MMAELSRSARKVGNALVSWQRERRFAGVQIGSQFKAEADRWAHELWQKELHEIAPHIPLISEEDLKPSAGIPAGRHWLLDPLDGTASFVGGFRGWVTQVALMEACRPVAAVVFAPCSDELFSAELGQGAFCNDRQLSLARRKQAESLVDNYPDPRGIAARVMRRHGLTRYVESGSIGLKICRIADGQADVFIKDVCVQSWDVASGDLILTEAGGTIRTLKGAMFDYRKRSHEGLVAARSFCLCQAISAAEESHDSLPDPSRVLPPYLSGKCL